MNIKILDLTTREATGDGRVKATASVQIGPKGYFVGGLWDKKARDFQPTILGDPYEIEDYYDEIKKLVKQYSLDLDMKDVERVRYYMVQAAIACDNAVKAMEEHNLNLENYPEYWLDFAEHSLELRNIMITNFEDIQVQVG